MLKSCVYCGKIHNVKAGCPKKPIRKKEDTAQSKFRSKHAWTKKSLSIKKRDGFLCQVCIRNLFQTTQQYTSRNLEVHHITPIREDYNSRLDDANLITLCSFHHAMADAGKIPTEVLRTIAKEQMERQDGQAGIPPRGQG